MNISLLVWILVGFLLSILVVIKPRSIYLTLFLVLGVFGLTYQSAFHERKEYYTPYYGTPTQEFYYNGHKIARMNFKDEDEIMVILWVTMLENKDERIYMFRYSDNKKLKRDLDKMKNLSEMNMLSSSPYRIKEDGSEAGGAGGSGGSNADESPIFETLEKSFMPDGGVFEKETDDDDQETQSRGD